MLMDPPAALPRSPLLASAAAAIVGGLIWMATVFITALRPIGIGGAYRSTLDLHPMILVSFILMASAASACASRLRLGRLGWTGAAVCWIGVAVFTVNVAFVLATGDDAPVWLTHYAGFFLMAVGISLVGVAGLLARALPLAAGVAMVVAPLVMPLGNGQDARVLLWLPLGIASLALGVATLVTGHAEAAA